MCLGHYGGNKASFDLVRSKIPLNRPPPDVLINLSDEEEDQEDTHMFEDVITNPYY